MKLLVPSLLCIGLLLEHATASSTSTKEVCVTRQGTKSIKNVPTARSTETTTLSSTVFVTLHPTVTHTPGAKTTTKTVHSTSTVYFTDSAITDVFSTTSTVLITSTFTSTPTSTQTQTKTDTVTTTSTSTIAAPAGFTPIQSSVNPPPSSSRRKRNMPAARLAYKNALVSRSAKQQLGIRGAKSYPQSVACDKKVYITPKAVTSTVVQGPTKTIIATPATRTSTKTAVSTSTSTLVPAHVHTTSSFLSTSTTVMTVMGAVSTTTATTTTTLTLQAALPTTVLAACQADNYVPANDIYDRGTVDSDVYDTDCTITNAYDCCAECQARSTCSGSGYLTGCCFLFISDVCPADGTSNGVGGFYTQGNPGDDEDFTVSNGACYTYYYNPDILY